MQYVYTTFLWKMKTAAGGLRPSNWESKFRQWSQITLKSLWNQQANYHSKLSGKRKENVSITASQQDPLKTTLHTEFLHKIERNETGDNNYNMNTIKKLTVSLEINVTQILKFSLNVSVMCSTARTHRKIALWNSRTQSILKTTTRYYRNNFKKTLKINGSLNEDFRKNLEIVSSKNPQNHLQ